MNNEQVYCLLSDNNYHEIHSNNKLMRSFANSDNTIRVNIYNTGTIQIQYKEYLNKKPIILKEYSDSDILKHL